MTYNKTKNPIAPIRRTMSITRRSFLALFGTTATSAILSGTLKNFSLNAQAPTGKGFGPLRPDPKKILDLPVGFQYKILSKAGDKLTNGQPIPFKYDGMASFSGGRNKTILIRNHEIKPDDPSAVIAPVNKKYDPLCKGGTTTLVINSQGKVLQEYVSLAGTYRNCGGGLTPWGTWISSEENTSTPADNKPNSPGNVSKKHGYNFEVSPTRGLNTPTPLTAMGRFYHEAVVIDPITGYAYQTEDREDGCLYRFRPTQYGKLNAGVLEALVIKGQPKADTSTNFPKGQSFPVEWVELENVDPEQDTLRFEAHNKGATLFKRGEGMCFNNGDVYWTCTSGGNVGKGQVFRYKIKDNTLDLVFESPGQSVLDYPDNLTMSPFGDLMICEDGWGEQFLVGITPEGESYQFAKNALNTSELAGICFSPDGQTMFVNVYDPGITLAVTGNWRK